MSTLPITPSGRAGARESTHDLPSLSSPEWQARREELLDHTEHIQRQYRAMFAGEYEYLTTREAADYLGITQGALLARIRYRPNILPHKRMRLGRSQQPEFCFKHEDIVAYRKSNHHQRTLRQAQRRKSRASMPDPDDT